MKKKYKNRLDDIIETIRDFRDDVYCLANYTNENRDCTCYKYDEIINQLEKILVTDMKYVGLMTFLTMELGSG